MTNKITDEKFEKRLTEISDSIKHATMEFLTFEIDPDTDYDFNVRFSKLLMKSNNLLEEILSKTSYKKSYKTKTLNLLEELLKDSNNILEEVRNTFKKIDVNKLLEEKIKKVAEITKESLTGDVAKRAILLKLSVYYVVLNMSYVGVVELNEELDMFLTNSLISDTCIFNHLKDLFFLEKDYLFRNFLGFCNENNISLLLPLEKVEAVFNTIYCRSFQEFSSNEKFEITKCFNA